MFKYNEKREGKRKGGLLINSGDNPTKESRQREWEFNREKFELSQEERSVSFALHTASSST